MAKKSSPPPAEPTEVAADSPLPLRDTSDLVADAANPRRITDEAAGGLRKSLEHFGDLSGIVYNRRSGELVCGHQRKSQIEVRWGVQPITDLVWDDEAGEGTAVIRVGPRHVFRVRVVDWSKAKQRQANVAANSQKIAGEFTADLASYLLEVQAEAQLETPGVMDDVLLTDLLSSVIDLGDDAEEEGGGVTISESYQVIVQCRDEEHQRQIYTDLTNEGLTCKVLTI